MLADIPCEVFKTLLSDLEGALKRRLLKASPVTKGSGLWRCLDYEENAGLKEELFGDTRVATDHFYKKKPQAGRLLMPIDQELFCRAVLFLQDKSLGIPDNEARLKSTGNFKRLGGAFTTKNFPENPEYLDYFKQPRHGNAYEGQTAPSVGSKKPVQVDSIFSSLNDAYFKSVYQQGDMIDGAILHLNTKGTNEVTGEFRVLYQDLSGYPPASPEGLQTLRIETGRFYYEQALSLVLKNIRPFSKHTVVMLLKYTASIGLGNSPDFEGDYLVDFFKIPGERKSQHIGSITFTRCSKELAEAFYQRPTVKLLEEGLPTTEGREEG